RHTSFSRDWSSDVCSSDLVSGYPVETALALWHGINLPLMLSGLSLLAGSFLVAAWHRLQPTLYALNTAASRVGPEAGYFRFMEEIGRASCRERVKVSEGGV